MNRRQLLKGLAALPAAGVAALIAVQNDGVALLSTPHPVGSFDASELDLTEESLEYVMGYLLVEMRLNGSDWQPYDHTKFLPNTVNNVRIRHVWRVG